MIEAKVVQPLGDPFDPTSLHPNGRPTSTSILRCYCGAPMSAPGLSELCSRCSRFGCRNAPQWHIFKARTSCRTCGHVRPPFGSRVRDAVAGIYKSRSLRVKTPVHVDRLDPGRLGVHPVHKAHVHDWEHRTTRGVWLCHGHARRV